MGYIPSININASQPAYSPPTTITGAFVLGKKNLFFIKKKPLFSTTKKYLFMIFFKNHFIKKTILIIK